MDINNSSLSRFRADKPEVSGFVSDSNSLSVSARYRMSTGSVQNQKLPDLKEGQLVKGQIIDRRYNDVSVQLEPSRQIVTARLSGDVPLSIGQNANFMVTEGASDHLVLKYLPEDASAPAQAAIQKVLSASNLPITTVNKAVVSELLNNRMPVDAQTLQTLIRLSLMNREATPSTLVLMYKNNIPITGENIQQFEAYQNGTNHLINDINTITNNLTELLKEEPGNPLQNNAADPANEVNQSNITDQTNTLNQTNTVNQNDVPGSIYIPKDKSGLLNSPAKSPASPIAEGSAPPSDAMINVQDHYSQAVQINSELIDILYKNTSDALPLELQNSPLKDLFNPKELTKLGKAIEQIISDGSSLPADTPADIVNQIVQGTIPVKETVTLLSELVSQGNHPDASVISKALNQLMTPAQNQSQVSEFLNSAEQTNLLQILDTFADASEISSQLETGTASVKDILTFLQSSLKTADKETAAKLLQSSEYSKLLTGAFKQRWTLTPEKVEKKAPVQELYQNLQEDTKSLSRLLKAGRDAAEPLQIREPLKNIQDNLKFMKDLNEVYTYLQLPVQLKGKKLHSDLYVFTNKKALRDKSDHVSVLLHLDMDHLGSMNVHIQLDHNQIKAKFSMEKQEAGQLIETNISILEEALKKKGYHLHAEVTKAYEKPNFSKDFIAQDTPENAVKLCSFDMRT